MNAMYGNNYALLGVSLGGEMWWGRHILPIVGTVGISRKK